MANVVICPETCKSLKHHELIAKLRYKLKWMRSTANEINRIYNTNTIRFIRRSNVPTGREVTYGSFVVDIKDHKEEKERTRLTVGGDQIEYPGEKCELSPDRKVYIEIQKGMYGLPQAGILTNKLLQRNLAKDGYRPTHHKHGHWTHNTRLISFSLVVDDFGVKYVGREHAEHLMTCIKKKYNISSD
jgi:hypothetical protein